jgi:hypothetical protein
MKEESLQKRWMRRFPIYHHTSSQIHRQKGVLYTLLSCEKFMYGPLLILFSPGPVVKKDDEPLLNLTGAISRCSRESDYIYTKEVTRVPSIEIDTLE